MLDIIRELGGSGVQEVQYNSAPDIEFEFLARRWLLSVKIGENPKIIKDSFLQYLRHKEESGLADGLLLLLPESIRSTLADEGAVRAALLSARSTMLVDSALVKDELREVTFPDALRLLRLQYGAAEPKHYPLTLVINLLRAQVVDMMEGLSLDEDALLEIVTNKRLLSDLGRLKGEEADNVGTFLGAYILLSQIVFLRFLAVVYPDLIDARNVTHAALRAAFDRVLSVNYRPIYELDVLDNVSEDYLRDTFDLIWGLQVDRVRYELPGRLFHELMPRHIRKLLAAFYTRPQAAEILAKICIRGSADTVFDTACGSGTILVAAYRQKLELQALEGRTGNPHKRFCENELFGADIMPFAVHLTSANLAAMDVSTNIAHTQIIPGDSIELTQGRHYGTSLQLGLFSPARRARTTTGEEFEVVLRPVDAVLGNPPFTKLERGISQYVDMQRFSGLVGGEVGLWGHFVPLAAEFLSDGGDLWCRYPNKHIERPRKHTRSPNYLF